MLLGGAAVGIAKLESALGRLPQHVNYARADRAQLAAVTAHAIISAHAFKDGNKRTAHVTMHAFLKVNGGYTTYAPKRIREHCYIDLARGIGLEVIAVSIRDHVVKIP